MTNECYTSTVSFHFLKYNSFSIGVCPPASSFGKTGMQPVLWLFMITLTDGIAMLSQEQKAWRLQKKKLTEESLKLFSGRRANEICILVS